MPKAPQTIYEDPIVNFAGFGLGGAQGEYFYSQGMNSGPNGIIPGWRVDEQADSGMLSGLSLVNWFSRQKIAGGGDNTYALDSSNNLYETPTGYTSWSHVYTPGTPGTGQGMIVDSLNRVLIAGEQYLSMYDGVTAPFTAGTVGVTNGSTNVIATGGQTFTSSIVGKPIIVGGGSYIVASQSGTGLVLATPYTGTTNAVATYQIVMAATDQFQNFTTAYSGLCPMDIYEDLVAIGRGNNIAVLYTSDGSFQPYAFPTLPAGYTVSAIRSGRTGLLVGMNYGSRGIVFLWDGSYAGAIAPWLYFNSNVQAIIPINEGGNSGGWYVFTTRGIYFTDGYQTQDVFTKFPDSYLNSTPFLQNLTAQGVDYISGKLVFLAGSGTNRQKAGVYILDISSELFEFAPLANGVQLGMNSGAVYFDGTATVHLSYETGLPNKFYISKLSNLPPSQAYFITEQKGEGGNVKAADAAKFTLTPDARFASSSPNMSFTLSLKVFSCTRPFQTPQTTNTAGTNTSFITVNGTSTSGAQVGDEVTVLQGVNAGLIRHITAITNQGTSSETWQVDIPLTGNIESGVYVVTSPFLLVNRFTFTNITELKATYFDIKSKYRGKKFMLKLLLENINSNTSIEIWDGQFFYHDLGEQAQ